MKQICFFLLSLCLVFSFAACSSPTSDPTTTTASNNTQDNSIYVFTVATANNFTVSIDQNLADVLAALGEPLSYFEAASCAFDGLDKTYTYAGFVITTRPDGNKDYVNSILLTDDSVTTPQGTYIGATAEEVISTYGDGTQSSTLISYTNGNTTLNFILRDNLVISIEYLPAQ